MDWIDPDFLEHTQQAWQARNQYRAARIPTRCANVLVGLRIYSLADLWAQPWEDRPGARGLRWRLSVEPGCGPRIAARIERLYRQKPAND